MRGKKSCPRCKKDCGARSWNCSCGAGFVIKGIQKPDVDVTAQPARSAPRRADKLLNLIEPYDAAEETERRGKYDIKGETWQSKDGKYIIRKTIVFMGVQIAEHFGNPYTVLSREANGLELIRPNHSFQSLNGAIRAMIKHQENKQ